MGRGRRLQILRYEFRPAAGQDLNPPGPPSLLRLRPVLSITAPRRYTAATSHRVFGIRDHRTAVRCTSLHRLPAAAIFYPNFYPKRQRSGAEMAYLLVTGTDWSRRPEYASSFPS